MQRLKVNLHTYAKCRVGGLVPLPKNVLIPLGVRLGSPLKGMPILLGI